MKYKQFLYYRRDNLSEITMKIDYLIEESASESIKCALQNLEGVRVDTINVQFDDSLVTLDFDEKLVTSADITESIENWGYPVLSTEVKS